MGDLIATCISPHSRNRYVGEQLGAGRTLDEILAEMNMVAEGVKTATTARQLAEQHGVPMPVCDEIYKVVTGPLQRQPRLPRPRRRPRPRARPRLTAASPRDRRRARLPDSSSVSDIDITTLTSVGWLSPEDLELVRANVPLVYVDAVPVRVDGLGRVTEVGLLLRVAADGSISRMVVSAAGCCSASGSATPCCATSRRTSARCALPRLPRRPDAVHRRRVLPRSPSARGSTIPATTPSAWRTSCRSTATASRPRRRSTWPGSRPRRRSSRAVREQMTGGHDRLIRLALAHVGCLP